MIRIQDTLTGELKALEPRDDAKVGIYACGPTVYGRVHVGNARPFVVFSLLKRFLEHQGYDVTLVANITDVNDKIYDAAREAGVGSEQLAGEMTAHYVRDTDRLGLGRPDREPTATGTMDAIVALIGDLIESEHAYVAEGDVYFRVGELSRVREALEPPDRRDAAGRGRRRRGAEGEPAGLRAVEGAEGGRGHGVGRALGPRPAGLAHRVLRDGGGDPRARLRDPRRRIGPRLPAPRERDRPDRGRARQAARAPLDAQRHGPARGREDGEVGGEHLPAPRGARPGGPRRARHVLRLGALPPADRLLGGRACRRRRVGGAHPRLRPPARSGRARGGHRALRRALLRGARGRLQHARGACGAVRLDLRGKPAPRCGRDGWVRGRSRRCCGSWASTTCSTADEGADPDAERLLAEREAARAARDFATADAKRDELAALGWTVRDTADGPKLVRQPS